MANARTKNKVVNPVNASEQQASVQEELFRSILQTPHGRVDEVIELHQSQMERDPDFYGKLAVYSLTGGCDIKDINEVFLACLFTSRFPEHREAAYCLLQDLPPYQVERVAKYFTGYSEIITHHSYEPALPKNGEFGLTFTKAKYSSRHSDVTKRGKEISRTAIKLVPKSKLKKSLVEKKLISESTNEIFADKLQVNHKCFGQKRTKGMLRRAIETYIWIREKPENARMMEGALVRAKNSMRYLYAKNQILPQQDERGWINQYLFHNVAPKNSRLEALKSLSAEADPTKQAQLIMDNKLPFPVVVSVVKNFTPTVWVALIEVMTPQELLQHLGSMKKHGVYDNADLKLLIEAKIKKAAKSTKRMDALKAENAANLVEGLDGDLKKQLQDVSDSQLKMKGEISAATAVLIDRSTSMMAAIEVGKTISSTLAQACKRQPYVCLFGSDATEITWKDTDGDPSKKSSWDEKLKMVAASGSTCPNLAVRAMMRKNVSVEQILLITDEGENEAGKFAEEMLKYSNHFGHKPNIVIMRLGDEKLGYPRGADNRIEKSLKSALFDVEVLKFPEPTDKAVRTALPNLIRMLSRKSLFDLVMEIRELELPVRSAWDTKNKVKQCVTV